MAVHIYNTATMLEYSKEKYDSCTLLFDLLCAGFNQKSVNNANSSLITGK